MPDALISEPSAVLSLTPMRPIAVLPPTIGRGRRVFGRCLVASGVLLLCASVGFLLWGGGIAAFVPSDPAVAAVGFTPGSDGTVRLVLDRRAASETAELDLYSGDPYADGAEPVWVAVRTARAPTTWADDLTVGQLPTGFVVTKKLTVPLRQVNAVGITNGCYGAPSTIPSARDLHAGKVTFYDDAPGDRLSVADAQNSRGEGYTPCGDDARTGVNGVIGLSLLVGGGAFLAVGTWVLRSARRRARNPAAGWFVDPQDRRMLRWWVGDAWARATRPR